MKTLVTGATGFVGSHLVERLASAGLDVVCLARPSSSLRWLEGLGVEVRRAGLDEPEALAAAVGDAELVFHVAGLTRARSDEAYRAVNVEGTRRLLEALDRSAAPVRRLVCVSSLAAAGPNPDPEPLDESAPCRPLPGYGASKLEAERLVRAAAGRLAVTIVRPPAVYGPRDTSFLPLFRTARRLGVMPFLGRASNQVTFVHAADLAEGLRLAGTHPAAAGQTYYLGGGTHTQGELADALAEALGRPLRRVRMPGLLARLAGEIGEVVWTLTGRAQIISRRKIRDALQPRWTCSWAKAQHELGYRPKVPLVEGLRRTADWYASEGWL